ncbi:sulfoacetaldehyde dehydrogenase [Natronocella acetinitrilica]|uniref:Sulfoacetaldehyde dehydrogenase n=1 Tax=Natronocella acetinitrilica TaxID=414046 RepID=A0AAE3KCJ8_9GAMM|nr:aldehyde dehydrogenase family protein [Natronocella acetinitrilica]MCP1676955.1 sulfoacetaldehyde dehydrogenase [Natronocella acetinitrilica]
MSNSDQVSRTESAVTAEGRVAGLVDRARAAQAIYEQYTQEQVDEVVIAVAWALINPEHNRVLSERAVRVTGLGNVADKITKNHRKTLGLLRDLQGAKTVGVIREIPERGLVEIARPVGVVGAIVPSTNPVATPANKTLNALKGRNAVILAPSPKGQDVCTQLIGYMHQELDRVGAPRDLVQQLPTPVDKESTYALMRQVDLMVVTGSQNNVRSAYSSGTPAFGVGAGNVPVIIDDSADLEDAARKITASKTFDNATSCSSENSLVIVDQVYDAALAALQQAGGVLLSASEKQKLEKVMWVDGSLNRQVIAKEATEIARVTGLDRDAFQAARFLLVEEQGIGKDHPFSGEKLSPVLTVYRAYDFDDAFKVTRRLLDHQGKGHSCGIHTSNDAHVRRLGLEMPVCRVIVNQAHAFANGGNFDNGLPFSLSMGCGTWGKNNFSDNLNYRQYLNITRIARTIPVNEPATADLFGDYWRKHDIAGS